MELLTTLCQKSYHPDTWPIESEQAFKELFGSKGGRFPSNSEKAIQFRTPKANVPFAAMIHETNPTSGGYSGMSFVIFPIDDGPAMIAMVIGTQGLSPDAKILGKPGHGRKLRAIIQWLNNSSKSAKPIAWAKRDPVRNDIEIPSTVTKGFPDYKDIFDKYGKLIYAFCIAKDEDFTENALKAFLDLNFSERGFDTLSPKQKDSQKVVF
jgi:5-methylcytosine-specific restriction protein B